MLLGHTTWRWHLQSNWRLFKITLISNFSFTTILPRNTPVTSELHYMFHTSQNFRGCCKFDPFVLLAGFRRDHCGLCCCQLPIVCVICCAVGQPPNRILSQRNTDRSVVRYWRKAREIREALIRTFLLTSWISLYLLFPKTFGCFLDCDLSVVPIGCAFFVKLLRRFFIWGCKYLTCLWRSWYWDRYSSIFILDWLNRNKDNAWASGRRGIMITPFVFSENMKFIFSIYYLFYYVFFYYFYLTYITCCG